MFRRFATAALCIALAACSSAQARPLVDLAVIDRDRGYGYLADGSTSDGGWLSPIRHRGQDWIEGAPGHRYSVRLTNTTGERVLVVLSVDGVNAVTGQTAHPLQAGYVLGPWESTEVNGWRKSLDDVAQFVFTDLPDSYAARTGRPDNVGVIGIAVFEEARPYYQPAPDWRREAPIARDDAAKAAAPAAEARATERDAAAQSLGTGHGEREWAPASRTGFVRATRGAAQVTQLRYDDYRTLVARGVLPREPRPRWRDDGPDAFPAGFVADPPR
ncbi:hypothetical protein [Lysobacter solisilvae (ex Woo and Kim 2020)]|uniref:Uncharacterized protein n=1 Tax=Agrilutibacter terrestris TaxID=2865112 RepID=A0A7H0FZL6_9GAMM|nr:hypothetical protein [Lysobacter terrestris]QNP41482.1 hypothetical protein H8B22_04480 [Lysobacter terrestris]